MQALLSDPVQEFIENYQEDPSQLAFKGSPFPEVDVKTLIQQIAGRRRIGKKLPLWYQTRGILYPPQLNLEQTSSEITAQYKASFCEGVNGADLTGGWGVDTFYLSRGFERFDQFETQQWLQEMARNNLSLLGAKNISFYAQDGLDGIQEKSYDLIYIDPSRRHESKGKVILLRDYAPDVIGNLPYLLDRCKTLLIKTAPMYDITQGLRELEHVTNVHVVSVNGEVKELLWVLQSGYDDPPVIKAVLLDQNTQTFAATWPFFAPTVYGTVQKYIYEPQAALLKAGLQDVVALNKQLKKLGPNTQLFTHAQLTDYPGRIYKVLRLLPYKKALIKKELTGTKALIVSRNFGETVAQLRKRWKIQDAEGQQLIFTRLQNGDKVVLDCQRIQ